MRKKRDVKTHVLSVYGMKNFLSNRGYNMDALCDYIDDRLYIDLWDDNHKKMFSFTCTPAEFAEMRDTVEVSMQPHDPTHDIREYRYLRTPSRFDGVI
jgi:hypothetical protein